MREIPLLKVLMAIAPSCLVSVVLVSAQTITTPTGTLFSNNAFQVK